VVPSTTLPGFRTEHLSSAYSDPRIGEQGRAPNGRTHGLAELSSDHRAILTAIFIDELTYEQTATRLAIPIGTVKSRAYYALRALRAQLDGVQAKPARRATYPPPAAEMGSRCSGRPRGCRAPLSVGRPSRVGRASRPSTRP
jgi:Sigma-70, region 4